jgi:hypothetical protein
MIPHKSPKKKLKSTQLKKRKKKTEVENETYKSMRKRSEKNDNQVKGRIHIKARK